MKLQAWHALAGLLPFDVNFSIAWTAVIRGMVSGLVICLLFTLLPLLAVRKVSPLVALRAAFAERAPAADPWRVTLGVLMVGAVVGFAIWQTRSLRIGLSNRASTPSAAGRRAGSSSRRMNNGSDSRSWARLRTAKACCRASALADESARTVRSVGNREASPKTSHVVASTCR